MYYVAGILQVYFHPLTYVGIHKVCTTLTFAMDGMNTKLDLKLIVIYIIMVPLSGVDTEFLDWDVGAADIYGVRWGVDLKKYI